MTGNPHVRVGVTWVTSKGRYFLKWKNPLTGRYQTQQTEITTRNKRSERKAAGEAEAMEVALRKKYHGSDDPLWDDFCDDYLADHLSQASRDHRYKWAAARKIFEDVAEETIGTDFRLSDITPRLLSKAQAEMCRRLSPGSVSSYMATLCGGLNWAASLELMRPMPRIRRSGREAGELPAMRLQPICRESLERMLDVSASVVGRGGAESVKDYLRCLWLSGCRMREPLEIHPNLRYCHHPVGLDGSAPRMFWVNSQKNRQDQIRRITLDFAADLREKSQLDRHPYRPRCECGEITGRTALSKIVSAIGKKAGVIAEPPGKTATAKHFRSSFVTRWSIRGMPLPLVQEMVRHADRGTTERYYVGDLNGKIDFDETSFLK